MPWLDHFDFLAPVYDRVITAVQPEQLKKWLHLPTDGYLLDVGGGTGRVAQWLTGYVGLVIVLDESPGMVREAKRKGLAVTLSQAERLPFQDGAISRILMVDTFHHLADQAKTAAELLRVLSPEGRLVIKEPDIECGRVKLVALAEKLALMRSHFYSPSKMKRLFEAAGGRVAISRDDPNFWLAVEKVP